jgi:hypothetical protein
MTDDKDVQLMHDIATMVEGAQVVAKRAQEAYLEWLRLDHRRLTRASEYHPRSPHLEERVAEARARYDELDRYYDEALKGNLAWIKAEFEKRS